MSKLLLSQLREVDIFFPSPVLVAGTVPQYILVSPSPSPMPRIPDVHKLYIATCPICSLGMGLVS